MGRPTIPPHAVLPQLALWCIVLGGVAALGGWGGTLVLVAWGAGAAILVGVFVARLWSLLFG